MKKLCRLIVFCTAVSFIAGCSAGNYKENVDGTPTPESPGGGNAEVDKYLTSVLYDSGDGSYFPLYTVSYLDGAITGMVKNIRGSIKVPENDDAAVKPAYKVNNFRYNQQNVLFDIVYSASKEYTEYYDVSLDGSYKAVKMNVTSTFGDTWEAEFFYLENSYLQSVRCSFTSSDETDDIAVLREITVTLGYEGGALAQAVYAVKDEKGEVTETVYNFFGPYVTNKGGIIHPDLDNGFYAVGPLVYGGMLGTMPEKLHSKCVYETLKGGESVKVNIISSYETDSGGYISQVKRTTEYVSLAEEVREETDNAENVEKFIYEYDYTK